MPCGTNGISNEYFMTTRFYQPNDPWYVNDVYNVIKVPWVAEDRLNHEITVPTT